MARLIKRAPAGQMFAVQLVQIADRAYVLHGHWPLALLRVHTQQILISLDRCLDGFQARSIQRISWSCRHVSFSYAEYMIIGVLVKRHTPLVLKFFNAEWIAPPSWAAYVDGVGRHAPAAGALSLNALSHNAIS